MYWFIESNHRIEIPKKSIMKILQYAKFVYSLKSIWLFENLELDTVLFMNDLVLIVLDRCRNLSFGARLFILATDYAPGYYQERALTHRRLMKICDFSLNQVILRFRPPKSFQMDLGKGFLNHVIKQFGE